MILDEKLFEAVQEGDVRGNYRKKALNREKLYDNIIDKIQRELSKKGFKVGSDGDNLYVNKKVFKQPNKEGKTVIKSKFMLDKNDYNDLINYLDSVGIEHSFKDDIEGLRLILNIDLDNVDKIKLTEDIEKIKSGKWVNKGKEGTHGEFKTKKAARDQQKAMFAQGFKEDINEPTIEEMLKYLKEYPQYNHQYTRPAKYYDLDLTPEQQDEFFNFLQDGLGNFWEENAALSQNIYQEGRQGGHLILDAAILEPKVFDNIESVDEMIEDELEYNYYPNNDDGTYDERQQQLAREEVEKEIKDSYITLKDFDERVDKLIENLKTTLDNRIEDKNLDEKLENNEIGDFFNKAKKLGVKNLGELKRLLNEPEAAGKTEKEKMDSYYKASNPEDKDLNEDTSMSSKTADNSKIDFDIKDTGDFTFKINGKEYKGHTDTPEEMSKDMKDFGFNLNEDLENGPKTENTGIAQMLIDAINGEWDTIKLYNDIMVNAEAYGYEDISNVIRDITNEENTHIGQLQKALETVSPNINSISQGEQEAENQLTDTAQVNELETYENN